MKIKSISLLAFLLWIGGSTTQAQVDVFFDIFYNLDIIFTSEGEPSSSEIDFSQYPYDIYEDGRFRPYQEVGNQLALVVESHLYGNDLDNFYTGTRLLFCPSSRMGISLSYFQLIDAFTEADKQASTHANLSFMYHRIRKPNFNLSWDIGISRNPIAENSQYGFSLGATGEWYVKKPLSIQVAFHTHQYSTVFSENLVDLEAKLRVHIKRFFIAGGLQYLDGLINAQNWTIGSGVYF